MNHEAEQDHARTTAAARVPAHNPVEPGQLSRSAMLSKPDHALASGLVQRKHRSLAPPADPGLASIQRKTQEEPSTHDIHGLAREGISGSSTTLPFLEQIQHSFGAHDVTGVRAHIGGPATGACKGMGATAYATGNHVAFHAAPDLHTAAHEAAHVVQQRAGVQLSGGVGAAGDEYERNADQVADLVVAGRSAETLLMGTGQHGQSTVTQRSHSAALSARAADRSAPDLEVGAARESTSTPQHGITQRKCDTCGAINSGSDNCPSCTDKASKSGLTGGAPAVQRQTAPGAATAPAIRHVKVWWNTFIPMATVDGPPGSECFTGDNRGFSNAIHASSRTHQEIEVDVTSLAPTINWKNVGTTHEVNCKTLAVTGTGTAPTSELSNGPITRSGSSIRIQFATAASNPLVALAPAIDSVVTFNIDPVARTCSLSGQHDGFPGYEAYVTADGGAGVSVYGYDPSVTGAGIGALFPPMDITVASTPVAF